jgi:hypothetical protein
LFPLLLNSVAINTDELLSGTVHLVETTHLVTADVKEIKN